jgi:hypothetical protein
VGLDEEDGRGGLAASAWGVRASSGCDKVIREGRGAMLLYIAKIAFSSL